MITAYDFKLELPLDAPGDAIAKFDRSIAFLLSTGAGTIPLDRDLGLNMDFLDKPTATAQALYTAEVTRKIARFIPGVRVREVRWITQKDGALIPKVVIDSVKPHKQST